MKTIKTGSDFSGVGAFDYAIERVSKQKGFYHKRIFACDWDKYARITYVHNHGEPTYYPKDVYDREIPTDPLDIYMTSPPCQDFSMAGNRPKLSDKTVLFLNSHEFIQKNNPRYFIFENVKGLLSHNGGKTFQEWLSYLAGKSINGQPVIFPDENSVPYHVYHKVLNTKKHGVPQNRERIFIIGIRDDADNSFTFPKEEHLTTKLKDILENEVDEKYFLSDKLIKYFINHSNNHKEKGNGFTFNVSEGEKPGVAVTTKAGQRGTDNFIRVKSATKKGYEEVKEGDSINFSVPNSETRRGRVGKEVAQTLDTACNQAVWIADYRNDEGLRVRKNGVSPCITASMTGGEEWKPKAGTSNPPLVGYNEKIRRLTPRECFRLQDFPDTFDFSVVSDTQAYKQAGNSITVRVLELIINKLFK